MSKGLDEMVRQFKDYVQGRNGYDELDFKEDIHNLLHEAYKNGYNKGYFQGGIDEILRHEQASKELEK